MSELARLGCVDVVDMKGYYRNVTVAMEPDPGLYRRVIEGLADVWIEDPAIEDSTAALLERHRDRITWDEPIRSVADIEGLPWRPRMLNLKPARFGSVRALFDTYDYCAHHGIGVYGGGMFEQGPGRGQLQCLASMFHPDAPNDLAPPEYNLESPSPTCRGLRWPPNHTRRAFAGEHTTGGGPFASPGRNTCKSFFMGSEHALLLIADIGGYTEYMGTHRMSLAHAEVNTARLLEKVIDAARGFDLIEIEGDAAFLSRYADPLDGAATAAATTQAAVGMHRAFHLERQYVATNLCPCAACKQAENLKLKFVAHVGEVATQTIRERRKLVGIDVILVHRLLKNAVQAPEYLLFSEELYRTVEQL